MKTTVNIRAVKMEQLRKKIMKIIDNYLLILFLALNGAFMGLSFWTLSDFSETLGKIKKITKTNQEIHKEGTERMSELMVILGD